MTTETITWTSVADALPDDDETVLVYVCAAVEPVAMGYHDAGEWLDLNGYPYDYVDCISHWAPMPNGPAN